MWERLAGDPKLLPAHVNEAMRLYPAVPRQVKILFEDMVIGGEAFAVGEIVVPNLSAAGRDPNVFPNPDSVDLNRSEPTYDIGFGHGTHYCLGHALAHAELMDGMTMLTRRLTEVAVDGPLEIAATGVIAGIEKLPIRYAAR